MAVDVSPCVDCFLGILYLVFAFCAALKGVLVGPVASLILILGNVGVILGMFPAHVAWTIYTIIKIDRIDIPLKVAIVLGLPALFVIWLGLSLSGSVLVGVGYGFFTPWVSTFEAFRHVDKSNKFYHCVVDGTWGTIKGSCTVVRDFGDLCYHSYPLYLKELRESRASSDVQPLRLVHIPACILVGVMGLLVDIPLYTAIAIAKSPHMLVKGWFRLTRSNQQRGSISRNCLYSYRGSNDPDLAFGCYWKYISVHFHKFLHCTVWISHSVSGKIFPERRSIYHRHGC